MENQIRIGDTVAIAGHAGKVENITIRTVRLRSLDGHMHIIPNSQITSVENKTHGWSRAIVDIDVAYKEDLDRVLLVMRDEADKMKEDAQYKEMILEKPKMLGVNKLGESAITIRLIVKTTPLQEWQVKRELYKRLKKRFDQEGISMPFPQMVVYTENA
jgi:small conductance mechanosensitive channel